MSKRASAAARTISIFTGKTDSEAPNARDGSSADPVRDYADLQLRPKYKWKRYQLTQYECVALSAMIYVENEHPKTKTGRWRYRVNKAGRDIGTFDSIGLAADAAEGVLRQRVDIQQESNGDEVKR